MNQTLAIAISDLQQLAQKTSDNYLVLSVYLPITTQSRADLATIAKSKTLEELRAHPDIRANSSLHEVIVAKVLHLLTVPSSLGKGLALFFLISPHDSANGKVATDDDDALVYTLPKQPTAQAKVARIPDLSQLVWSLSTARSVLIINLEQKEAKIYLLLDSKLDLIDTFENEYIVPDSDEYMEVFSPIRNQHIHHSSGSENISRKQAKQNAYFLDELITHLKEEQATYSSDLIYIFHSNKFNEFIPKISQELKAVFGQTAEMVFCNKTFSTKDQLLAEMEEQLHDRKVSQVEQQLEIARESYPLFCTGWYEVSKASRQHAIDTLFMKANVEQQGYVREDLVYTHPAKDTTLRPDIAPWLIYTTLATGGNVRLLKESAPLLDAEVAAQLRY